MLQICFRIAPSIKILGWTSYQALYDSKACTLPYQKHNKIGMEDEFQTLVSCLLVIWAIPSEESED